MKDITVIAEAGVNHNGSLDVALRLVDAAVNSGANVVKFQTFKSSSLVTSRAKQAEYQKRNIGVSESQHSMLSRLELSYDDHLQLQQYCATKKIDFLSTAFESESLNFLIKKIGLRSLKIPSGEITNAPFLLEHAQTGCDIILSTGMASLSDIENALSVIAFGFVSKKQDFPTIEGFQKAYASPEGQSALKNKVTLLHCTTEYPAPFDEINLRAMDTLKAAFDLNVGLSDHSKGITIPIAAAAREAVIIEKHFTLDRNMIGPDHKASLEPDELKLMVDSIRLVEKALGSKIKTPSNSELKNRPIVRKSLIVAAPIKAGDMFTSLNLDVKRPGNGKTPFQYWDVLGTIAKRDYQKGEILDEK